MRIAVFGSGYVGLVTGTCLSDAGNHVDMVDIDPQRVSRLNAGHCPIYEPGLEEMMQTNQKAGRLSYSTDAASAVKRAEVIFIAVGTPPRADGSADLSAVESVALTVARHANGPKIVAVKSTVPVGTGRRLAGLIMQNTQYPITVVSNPEFLKEGTAVDDFVRPDRVVVGTDSPEAAEVLRELYNPFVRNNNPVLIMSREASEMTKYAANCLLACRISFINEIANLCEAVGVNVDEVRQGIGTDARIGFSFLYPGAGYGGSCFPKDVQALAHVAHAAGADGQLLTTIHEVNLRQQRRMGEKVLGRYGENLAGKTFALWGGAFKPKTDDIREAPVLVLLDALFAAGASVKLHDPKAMPNLARQYEKEVTNGRLRLCEDAYDALTDAEALIIMTEWAEFRSPDFAEIKQRLRQPVIFDGRNVYTPKQMKRNGFTYYSIGRPALV